MKGFGSECNFQVICKVSLKVKDALQEMFEDPNLKMSNARKQCLLKFQGQSYSSSGFQIHRSNGKTIKCTIHLKDLQNYEINE